MLELLTLIHIATAKPLSCEISPDSRHSWEAHDTWTTSKMDEYRASKSSDKDRIYKYNVLQIDSPEYDRLFNFQLEVIEKLQFRKIAMNAVACFVRSGVASVITASQPSQGSLSTEKWIPTRGIDRVVIYLRMAVLLQDLLSRGALVEHLPPKRVVIPNSDPYSAQIDILSDILPIDTCLENKRAYYLDWGLAINAIDFAQYNIKRILDLFIYKYEQKCESDIDSMRRNVRNRIVGPGSEGIKTTEPLPEFFTKMMRDMLDSDIGLDEVVGRMARKVQKLQNLPHPLFGSQTRSPYRLRASPKMMRPAHRDGRKSKPS